MSMDQHRACLQDKREREQYNKGMLHGILIIAAIHILFDVYVYFNFS
jgi:hypothetical protein